MKQFWKYALATMVGLLLFSVVSAMITWGVMGMMLALDSSTPVMRPNSVYKIELEGVLKDRPEQDDVRSMIGKLSGRDDVKELSLQDLLRNLAYARDNSDVRGIVLYCGALQADYASLQELRKALQKFKDRGGFILAYADDYTQSTYYLASVADAVYLNPSGSLEWSGLYTTLAYFSRLLDKVGVEMQVVKVGEFKSAVETYIQTGMSDAARLQLEELQGDLWKEVRHAVSESRNISEEKLDEYAEMNMLFADPKDLVAYGFVDTLHYRSDMGRITQFSALPQQLYYLSNDDMSVLASAKEEYVKDKIAVIYAEGAISDSGTEGIVREDMMKTIRKVADDDNIRAVVLRVNSPGGSAYASEQIWYELSEMKTGKPLVVSMGGYAASGGYYISCLGDSIFADENTITGSIGIFGLVPCVKELSDKVGVDFDCVQTHHLSSSSTSMIVEGLSPEERVLMQGMINRGYEQFVGRCAEGRGMTTDEIKAIAEGRVWSGKKAMEIGLVDAMGGTHRAIESAARMAGLTKYEVVAYPKPKDSFTQLMEMLSGTDTEDVMTMGLKKLEKTMKESKLQARLPYEIQIH